MFHTASAAVDVQPVVVVQPVSATELVITIEPSNLCDDQLPPSNTASDKAVFYYHFLFDWLILREKGNTYIAKININRGLVVSTGVHYDVVIG